MIGMSEFSTNCAGRFKEGSRLECDNLVVNFAGKVIIFDGGSLKGFAFHQCNGRLSEINIEILIGSHQLIDFGEKKVTCQQGKSASPNGVDRGTTTTYNAMIVNIIMHDAGGMYQFNGSSSRSRISIICATEGAIG